MSSAVIRKIRSAVSILIAVAVLFQLIYFIDISYLEPNKLCGSGNGFQSVLKSSKSKFSTPILFAAQQEFLVELLHKRTGQSDGARTNISVIGAHEFYDQISVTMTSMGRYGELIYCRYFSNMGIEIGTPFEAVVIPDFVVHCERRDQAEFISLSNSLHDRHEYPVPIVKRAQKEPKHLFAVCVAPIFGKEPKWLALAELIEHYKLQGATYFYVYVKDIDDYTNVLLKDYARTNDAEIIYLHDNFSRPDVLWQKVELQECIVRARGHSHWVAFIDIDETILMTRFQGTIADYLRQISDPGIGGLKLRQQWVLRNESLPKRYVNDKQLVEWLQTRRYHNTSRVAPAGYASKCILDPQKVAANNIHYVDAFFPGYYMYMVKAEEGVIRQYRYVNSGTWLQYMLPALERMGNFSMTDYPKELQQQLTVSVLRRVGSVYSKT